MNESNGAATLDRKELKENYLACFGRRRPPNMEGLRHAVRDLVHLGVSRRTLFRWGLSRRFSGSYVSSLLSRLFAALGLREGRSGGGRKPSADAIELHARNHHGKTFLRVLRAAWRLGKPQTAAESAQEASIATSGNGSIVAHNNGPKNSPQVPHSQKTH
jgi:hypothetical protein